MGRFSNLEFDGQEPLREENRAEEPRDEKYYLRLGDREHRSARFEKALRYYSRALEFNPNVHAAWVGQVQMLVELGEYKEGRLWADKALEIHRDHPEILSAKAVACARLGESQRAVEFSDLALSIRGTSQDLWLARGEALLAGARGNDEHCFERAASESKGDWFMQLRIGRVCSFYGDHARGMARVQKAMKVEAGEPFVWHALGDCRRALGFASEAEQAYRQALSIDPDFPPTRAALAALSGRSLGARLRDWLRGRFGGRS